MGRGGQALIAIVFLLAVVPPPLLRSGVLDFTQPLGMVDRPCEAAAERLGGRGAILRGTDERRRLADWAGLCHFRAENERLAARAKRPRVVMIGDSITAFWRQQDPGFFSHNDIQDRGIVGQTTAQILLRFEQDVVALRPGTVHIMAGLNDIAGNTGLTRSEDFRANIRAMVAIARANGIHVVLGSVTPASGFYWRPGIDPRSRITELNLWLRNYAAEQGLAYADYSAVLVDPDSSMQARFDHDGSHPNAAGYAAMRPIAQAALAKAERGAAAQLSNPAPSTGMQTPEM